MSKTINILHDFNIFFKAFKYTQDTLSITLPTLYVFGHSKHQKEIIQGFLSDKGCELLLASGCCCCLFFLFVFLMEFLHFQLSVPQQSYIKMFQIAPISELAKQQLVIS